MITDKLASYPAAKKDSCQRSSTVNAASISPPRVPLTHNHQVDGAGVLVHTQRATRHLGRS